MTGNQAESQPPSPEQIEFLGEEAAQEVFFLGKKIMKLIKNKIIDDNIDNILEKVIDCACRTLELYSKLINSIKQSLPLSPVKIKTINEINWGSVTDRGVEIDIVQENDRLWHTICSGIKQGDPLVSPRLLASTISSIISELFSIQNDTHQKKFHNYLRIICLYSNIIKIGYKSSYANMAVGKKLDAETVPMNK